ncbi:uncharacterized protein LOC108655367, partial [Drosophila navojoa]|uniref:uncharacterized protein LOC108655367 n=1 Tax=Drosophila navojoa TaxID=7232 RepID=UPI0011BE372E
YAYLFLEKFKGLDAPSIPHVPKLEIQKDTTNDVVDIPKIKKFDSLERLPDIATVEQKPPCCDPTTSNEINRCNEEANSAASETAAFATLTPNSKHKKSKKKNITTGQKTNDLSAVKAVDKARRKALKIYQKLSKNQIESGSSCSGSNGIDLKKMKILNRGILSDLPDGSTERTQFEKLIKKQTKLKQKQLKYQKQQQLQLQQQPPGQFQSASKFSIGTINTMPVNPFSSANPVPLEQPVNEVGLVPPAVIQIEDKEAYNIAPAPNIAIELIDEIKLANEPDRNKLNIFKKISKQKVSKLNVSSSPYENANNVASPLINLPSGTTITPAPPAPSANENITNTNLNLSLGNLATYDYLNTYPQSPSSATNLLNNDLNKPKKRGRKPGGKNQCRPQASSLTNILPIPSSIQIQKKTKATKLNPVCTYQDSTTVMPTLPTTVPIPLTFAMPVMEPLNLSHVDQLKSNISLNFSDNQGEKKVEKPKEKKEKKKSKIKYQDSNIDNAREMDKKICLMDSEMKMSKASTLVIGADSDTKLVGSLGFETGSGPRTISNNERNIMPMLPLLHFPPRPGLIPTGPGLFSPNLTGFNKSVVCGTASNLIMSHSFMNFSATAPDNKAAALSGLMPLSDIHMERSYCNVAPLVPDSMKIPTGPVEGVKLKSPHQMLTNECADAEVTHRSTVVQAVNEDFTNTRKAQVKLLPAATGNVGDPIEVSDSDSNDGESKANNSLSPSQKTNLKQPSSLMNPVIETCQLYAINSSPLLQPKCNRKPHSGTLKIRQTDENKLPVAPPSSQPTTATTTTTTAAATKQATTTPFKIHFMGSDKFSLAGGADLIPLSRIDSGLAYSSLTVPSTSLAVGATSGAPTATSADATMPTTAAAPDPHFLGALGYDDLTITPTNMTISELKIRKLHKKFKKPKEGKIKKKKDKKEKIRNKCKADDMDVLSNEKIKSEEKKLRKDKKRKKQLPTDRLQIIKEIREAREGSSDIQLKNSTAGAMGHAVIGGDVETLAPSTFGHSIPMIPNSIASPNLDLSPNHIPRLTLKLSGRSSPSQPTVEGMDYEHDAVVTNTIAHPPQTAITLAKREHSPELARFSPLVTRAPKPKQCETQHLNLPTAPSASVSSVSTKTQAISPMMSAAMPLISTQSPALSAVTGTTANNWTSNAATSTISASSVLLPQQLMQPTSSLSLSLSPIKQSSRPSAALNATKVSDGTPTPTTTQSAELSRPSSYVDADGYRIWICPACGKVDDGSAMIGCDGCDAWYHWTCVGILVAPNDNEDWFCRVCVSKKKVSGSEKKKKRNKKKLSS